MLSALRVKNVKIAQLGVAKQKLQFEAKQRLAQCYYFTSVSTNRRNGAKIAENKKQSLKIPPKSALIGSSGILLGKNCPLHRQSVRSLSQLPGTTPPQVDWYLKFFVDNPLVEFSQNSLIWLHSATGLPWWVTIIALTVTARTLVTVPCALYQQYILAKVANLKYDMDEIIGDLKREANYRVQYLGISEAESRRIYNQSVREKWNELIVQENCHPMKGYVLILTQLPLWVMISASIRNLCFMLPHPTPLAQHNYLQLSEQGAAWFTSLVAVDPYFILPVTFGLLNLMNIEMQNMMRVQEPTKMQRISLNIFRAIVVMMVPISAMVPSAMSLYWATSSAYGFLQNLLLLSPRIRRFCRIPETDNELQQPYKHLLNNMKKHALVKALTQR